MKGILSIAFFIFILPGHSISQITPKEASNLNYRLIGFSFPSSIEHIINYTLEIANGNFNSDDSFKKNIIRVLDGKERKLIAEVPSFGKSYTWRVIYTTGNATKTVSPFFHFNTKTCPNVDTAAFRFRIQDSAVKYKDAYVFIDDNKTLYDMNGRPVWFLPLIEGIPVTPRDIKLSPQATITFLFDPPYEVNYNGDVLWKAPQHGIVSGDYSEHFHHEFTRLHSGHYMVLGIDSALWKHKIPIAGNSKPTSTDDNDTAYRKMAFGSLIEYDEKGKVAWSWRSADYFSGSDLKYYIPSNDKQFIDVHANSFYFDEKEKCIYVSFKNISRILKVKYPEGTVINAYGEKYKPGVPESGNSLFCGQHACKHSDNGYLYLYNNNYCDTAALPKIIKMKEPDTKKKGLQKIWEYECTIEGINDMDKAKYRFISGGNVEELPDRSVFVCMSGIYSKIFIVSEDKKILWSALPERWNATEKKWDIVGQYRASIIYDHKDLERLIWNSSTRTSSP